MFDLHTHILPALDDGAVDIAASVAMAREAHLAGVVAIAGTPHVRDDYPTTPAAMLAALATLREALAEADVGLEVLPGGEIDLQRLRTLDDDALRAFGLAGNPEYLLIEFPYYGWPNSLASVVLSLRRKGVTAVLAHPERSPQVQSDPSRLREAVDAGAILQVTMHSLMGGHGKKAERAARTLVDSGAPCLLASDSHSPDGQRTRLARPTRDSQLLDWLLVQMPAAIVYGGRLPPRPGERLPKRIALSSAHHRGPEVTVPNRPAKLQQDRK